MPAPRPSAGPSSSCSTRLESVHLSSSTQLTSTPIRVCRCASSPNLTLRWIGMKYDEVVGEQIEPFRKAAFVEQLRFRIEEVLDVRAQFVVVHARAPGGIGPP